SAGHPPGSEFPPGRLFDDVHRTAPQRRAARVDRRKSVRKADVRLTEPGISGRACRERLDFGQGSVNEKVMLAPAHQATASNCGNLSPSFPALSVNRRVPASSTSGTSQSIQKSTSTLMIRCNASF